MLEGYKAKIGAVGAILCGLGGILSHKLDLITGLGYITGGITAFGFRSFGDKLLEAIKALIAIKSNEQTK